MRRKRTRETAALVPSPAIHRRLFIVGCPGAGATTVRDLLASQPGLHSFPRTHLFLRSFGMRGRRLPWAWLGFTLGKERRILERVAERATATGAAPPALPPRSLLLKRSLDGLLATFDRLALAAECRNWMESTPRHLVHARLIGRLVPKSRIIHVVRDGRDVVADQCSGPGRRDPRAVVATWNRALVHHVHCLNRPGHVFVLYEDLLADPVRELGRVMHECGLQNQWEAGRMGLSGESDSRAVTASCEDNARQRFRQSFSSHSRRRIERALHLHRHGRLAEQLRSHQSVLAAAVPRIDPAGVADPDAGPALSLPGNIPGPKTRARDSESGRPDAPAPPRTGVA